MYVLTDIHVMYKYNVIRVSLHCTNNPYEKVAVPKYVHVHVHVYIYVCVCVCM